MTVFPSCRKLRVPTVAKKIPLTGCVDVDSTTITARKRNNDRGILLDDLNKNTF